MTSPFTMFGVAGGGGDALYAPMLGAVELLAILEERKVTRAEIARILKLPSSRISELYSGNRRLQLDEAKKLVEHFGVEERVNPLSVPIARLLVLHAADALKLPLDPEDGRVEEIARDFRAFSQFAADPRARESVEAVEAFFRGCVCRQVEQPARQHSVRRFADGSFQPRLITRHHKDSPAAERSPALTVTPRILHSKCCWAASIP